MTPLVVGVCHGGRFGERFGLMLNAYSSKRFIKEVCPEINNNTLLVLEGAYRRKLFYPWKKKYSSMRKIAERQLGAKFPGSPIIAWRDPRMFPFHRAVIGSEFEDTLEALLSRIPQPGITCRSLKELLRRIERGVAPHLSRHRGLSFRQKLVLWNNAKEMREFDRCVTAAAKKYMDMHQVIIVCGLAHALEIARKEQWRLTPLIRDSKTGMSYVLRVYHSCYVLPAYFPLSFR